MKALYSNLRLRTERIDHGFPVDKTGKRTGARQLSPFENVLDLRSVHTELYTAGDQRFSG